MRTLLRILLPLLILVVGASGAAQLAKLRKPPEPKAHAAIVPLVRCMTARAEPVTLVVHAQGTVEPRTETRLVAEVSARVLDVSSALASGGFFQAGDRLVELDPIDLLAIQEEARARLASAELELVQQETDAAVARREWEELGRAEEPSRLALREPQVARARAQLAAAQAALAKAERDVERCTIRAPYTGRVRSRDVDRGQYVERGKEVARIFAVDYAEVRLPVRDAELARLDLPLWSEGEAAAHGPNVELRATFGGEERRWQAHVVRSEGELDPRTRSLVLVARIEDPYGLERSGSPPLLAGLFVDAAIEGRRIDDAVILPRGALRAGDQVYVLSNENALEIRQARVHEVREQDIVLSSGVAAGEKVIVSPIEIPIAGMALREDAPPAE